MAVDEALSGYSTTAASNTPSGSDTVGPDLDNHLRDIKKNLRLAAELSQSASQPGGFTGQLHFNTSASPTYTLKIYDGADWVSIVDIDASANTTNVYDRGSLNAFANTDTSNTYSSGTQTFNVAIDANSTLDVSGAATFQSLATSATSTFKDVTVNAIWTDNATGGDQGADTINASALYDDGNQIHALQDGLQGETATTSGTSHTLASGIRSDAERITVFLDDVGLDGGTDDVLIQIGDSGGFETSGYDATNVTAGGGNNSTNTSSSGWIIRAGGASFHLKGTVVLERMSGNKWFARGTVEREGATQRLALVSGDKTLSGTLTQVRIIRSGTTDSFDNGAATVRIE